MESSWSFRFKRCVSLITCCMNHQADFAGCCTMFIPHFPFGLVQNPFKNSPTTVRAEKKIMCQISHHKLSLEWCKTIRRSAIRAPGPSHWPHRPTCASASPGPGDIAISLPWLGMLQIPFNILGYFGDGWLNWVYHIQDGQTTGFATVRGWNQHPASLWPSLWVSHVSWTICIFIFSKLGAEAAPLPILWKRFGAPKNGMLHLMKMESWTPLKWGKSSKFCLEKAVLFSKRMSFLHVTP